MPFWREKSDLDPVRNVALGAFSPPAPPPTENTAMNVTSKREPPASPGDLLLGDGAEFEGKLKFAGTVRIDARFTGSITTNDVLVLGERSKVAADITCGTVIVFGEVTGNIKASQLVELRETARVKGDIETPAILIDRGVVFQGSSRMPEPGAAVD
ncbi:MAG: polymer-forming cytoskeletal protein [Anaeromyxobacteraceae bacterium]